MNFTKISRDIIKCSRLLRIVQVSSVSPAILRCQSQVLFFNGRRNFSVFSKSPDYNSEAPLMDLVAYETVSSEALEALSDYFEELVDADPKLNKSDIAYSDGVLTVKLGEPFGTYVINRQTPNRQLWLSSPTSGPKRYDFVNDNWIYKHDGVSLHQLLQNELEKIVAVDVDFLKLASNKK